MPAIKKTTLFIALLTLSAISWIGCSDNTIVTYIDNPAQGDLSQAVETYFPLDEGYTTVYNVTYSSGGSEQVTFKAGKTVTFQGIDAVEWVGINSNSVDVGYFYAADDALYYYSSVDATPEKVLQLPLTHGASWATNDINSDDFTDIITGTKVDTANNPDINSKTFPTISAVNFTVDEIENLELNTGTNYNQTVRISTPNGSRMNYYWYAPGIGLVRYVIGASEASYPNGEIVGELVRYGF